ncbi:MAG: response regulator [Pseudomonadota bacterium]|nr:response regulator [Pseudomonadota bacterium]
MKTLTTGEAAALCGVNFRTVIRWVEKGLLKAHRLPGRGDHRILVEDFVEFLECSDIPIPMNLQPLNPALILVIDDQIEVARSYERVLRRTGYTVEVVTDGFHAGIKLLSLKPNLIILDLKMPGVDGFAVLKFVRQEKSLKSTKVLVASGADESSLKHAIELGANVVLPKPFANAELVQEVTRLSPIPNDTGVPRGLQSRV